MEITDPIGREERDESRSIGSRGNSLGLRWEDCFHVWAADSPDFVHSVSMWPNKNQDPWLLHPISIYNIIYII